MKSTRYVVQYLNPPHYWLDFDKGCHKKKPAMKKANDLRYISLKVRVIRRVTIETVIKP